MQGRHAIQVIEVEMRAQDGPERESQEALRKSLHKKIFILPQETAVYPGHGPNTNVGEELANNPYLWL